MNKHLWINKYGTVAILLMILLVMNPELREFLMVTNLIGLDLMTFFFLIQLGELLATVRSFHHPVKTTLCVVWYTCLRVATRAIALLLAPADRLTTGLTTFLFILSTNMWCPALRRNSAGV